MVGPDSFASAHPHAGSGVPRHSGWRIALADIGLLPFLLVLPFLYVPKVLEGDTQPWVLIAALIALFSYRPRQFIQRKDLPAILLGVLALAAYVARAGLGLEAVRAAYIFLTFAVFWILANRGGHDWFRIAVRYVLLVWFLVGLYQFLALRLGLPVSFAGRFIEGRNALPSLTAEPSYFGSLSVLMAMYLLHDRKPGDGWFVALATLNVLMSGSLLSVLLLGFPLLYLRFGLKVAAAIALFGLLVLDATFNEAGIVARLAGFQSAGEGLVGVILDPSLNLRIGHVWFALWSNLPASLVFAHPIDFQNQYNAFAAGTGVLIPTESNFILPIAGELVYNGGLFGAAIVAMLVYRGASAGPTFGQRLIRGGFIIACLLNPISIANPFLIFYVLQEKPCQLR
jgi:hypothetical protein